MKELFDILLKNDITPNGFFILYSINEGVTYSNYIKSIPTECYILKTAGWIEDDPYGGYNVTKKGLQFLRTVKTTLKGDPKKFKLDTAGWDEYIKTYTNIFPAGTKTGSTYSFRSSVKELQPRFEWFFIEYPEYNWDDVIKATTYYVTSHKDSGNLTYMMLSKYFIKKEEKDKTFRSELAEVIYNMKAGNTNETNEGFHYFGP